MKIIDEIEKSRLSDNEMNAVTGGLSFTLTVCDGCSEKQKYNYCSSRFEICECNTKISCPATYLYACTGTEPSKWHSCPGFGTIIVHQ